MITIGYHTLEDKGNVDEIEMSGPKPCYRPNAWLGDGYYFWDGDIDWAHDWGKNYKEYMIFTAEIHIDELTYDLFGNTLQKKEFWEIVKKLVKKGKISKLEDVKVSWVIEYIKKHIGFDYNSIRAADYPQKAFKLSFGGNRSEFMYVNERVQICLISKKNLTSSSFKAIYPEEYII